MFIIDPNYNNAINNVFKQLTELRDKTLRGLICIFNQNYIRDIDYNKMIKIQDIFCQLHDELTEIKEYYEKNIK